MAEPVQLYICYAEENKNALSRLERQLKALIVAGKIQPWHRGEITPGDNRGQSIVAHLDQAQIILMLVSGSLFGEYYNSPEMQRAFQLHKEQNVRLIPIIVEPCAWEGDLSLGSLEPLPRGGKPAVLDGKAWLSVATEINKVAIQMQSEQAIAIKEPASPAKSSRPRAKSRNSVAGSKSQPISGAVMAIEAPTITRPPRSTPPPAPAQPALLDHTLPSVEEPEPATDEARATTPAFGQDYGQTENDRSQIVYAILIWEPSQSIHDLIVNERRAIYRALLDKRHQCTLGSALFIPDGQSLQDCEISQAYASDMTVLLLEPETSPISEWYEFYRDDDDAFTSKILCYYPETAKSRAESWRLDETLYWLKRLSYYQETEITSCQVRTEVLKFVEAKRIQELRSRRKSRSGR
jgi:hypothetical protein